jgi:DNA-binding XRE family transcriptional regulator
MEQFLFPFKGKELNRKTDSTEIIRGGKPKTVELASDFESWYSYYSLSLLKQKKFQDCIDISKEALFTIEKFHYNNDLWFARKIALSNKGLGNILQAIGEMEEIERRKSEWFIQKELAELYFENQQNDLAKSMACSGALNYGDKEKKDGLFFLLGQIFRTSGEQALAHKHFLLVNLLRNEQGWFVPNRLKIALEETFLEGLVYDNSVVLYKELLNTWRANTAKGQILEKDSGKIVKVNPQKQIGEIVGKGGEKYFFHFNNFRDNKDKIQLNAQVVFVIKEPKGDRPGMNLVAHNIKLRQ